MSRRDTVAHADAAIDQLRGETHGDEARDLGRDGHALGPRADSGDEGSLERDRWSLWRGDCLRCESLFLQPGAIKET